VNHVEIQSGRIGADQKLATPGFNDRIGIGELHVHILNAACLDVLGRAEFHSGRAS
jgi:hypothetical protein